MAAISRNPIESARSWSGVCLYTVGHSTRSLDELVALLRAFDVTMVVDIRTIPRSRHNPQFGRDALGPALRSRKLRYFHLPELGGLRRARKDSPNAGWRNASFRGFADYMLTEDFEGGLVELRVLASAGRVALMCAEAVPWRCHRSLVADALSVRGARVEHITSTGRSSPHRLTDFAEVEGTRVTYPSAGGGRLATRGPFHLEATVRVLQRRPTNLVDVWEHEKYLRVLGLNDGLELVEVRNLGTIDLPDVRFRVLRGNLSVAELTKVEQIVRRVLGMDVDPAPLRRRAEAEPRLAATARALRGMRPPRFAGLFEAFASVVPFQQLSLDAGIAIVSRLVERFGKALEHGNRTYHAFPEADVVAGARIDSLGRCGLSRPKAEALRRAARAIASGQITEQRLVYLSSEEATRLLCELPGIGPWSAGVILLRGLGRLDVFPPGDVGVARGLSALMHLQGSQLERAIERFGEQRGYLYFCSLGGKLLARDLIHAAPPTRQKRSRTAVRRG
jgi:3-methyladenine DNA glycosylase/8-oxoguanine DNA glycosylase